MFETSPHTSMVRAIDQGRETMLAAVDAASAGLDCNGCASGPPKAEVAGEEPSLTRGTGLRADGEEKAPFPGRAPKRTSLCRYAPVEPSSEEAGAIATWKELRLSRGAA
jgi:hypothetical protein